MPTEQQCPTTAAQRVCAEFWHPTGTAGSVVFEVWTDGVLVWRSPVVTGADPASPVEVDLTGKNQVRLRVTDGGDGAGYDHADWADARLTCSTT